jgi:hypothetical protein
MASVLLEQKYHQPQGGLILFLVHLGQGDQRSHSKSRRFRDELRSPSTPPKITGTSFFGFGPCSWQAGCRSSRRPLATSKMTVESISEGCPPFQRHRFAFSDSSRRSYSATTMACGCMPLDHSTGRFCPALLLLLGEMAASSSPHRAWGRSNGRAHGDEALAMLMQTSGSTGNSKAVRITHKRVLCSVTGKLGGMLALSGLPF